MLRILSLLLIACAAVAAPVWQESFEGEASVAPYHRDAPQTVFAIVDGDAAEGQRFLRATLPGRRRLEGVRVEATGLSGGRVATVTAQVRGEGELWLCLLSRNGWLYAPETIALTDQWQTVRLSKALAAADTTLSVNFLTRDEQAGAVFDIDAVTVELADPPATADVAVGPWRLEAEAFAPRAANVADAEGVRVVRDGSYWSVDGVPFPRTSRPVTVYARVLPGASQGQLRLVTRQAGAAQVLGTVDGFEGAGWQWVAFPPLTAGEVGDSFSVDYRGKGVALALDSLALATEAGLDAAALDAAPALLAGGPSVAVPVCGEAPAIDGTVGADWAGAAALGGFRVTRTSAPAEAATQVRLCRDDQHLYVAFEADEPILEVAQQRLHEFKQAVTEADGEVWRDDAFALVIDPTGNGDVLYDLFINARGTLADARGAGPNPWGTRDAAWSSDARVAARTDEGRWSAELAIPFAAFGGAPTPGQPWQFNVGHIAQARGETSTWVPTATGLHDSAALGRLSFPAAAQGVGLPAPRRVDPGEGTLPVALGPGSGAGVLALARVEQEQGARVRGVVAAAAAALPLPVGEAAAVTLTLAALDAASFEPLYLSPAYAYRVGQSRAVLTLTVDAPFEVYHNAQRIARGERAAGQEVGVSLQRGANVLALKTAAGEATATLAAPGMAPKPVRWKLAPSTDADMLAVDHDDAAWPTAEALPDGEKLLRHTLLWEATRQWPRPDPALFVAQGSNQHITLTVEGLPGRPLLGWTGYLAVPEGFAVLGATGYYGTTREPQPQFTAAAAAPVEIEGQPYRVWSITADKPVRSGQHPIMSLVNVLVRADAAPSDEPATLWYWTSANDGTVTEAPRALPVVVLPPLDGRQPEHLVVQMWGSFFGNMDDPAMREATLETLRQAGFNNVVAGDAWTSENAPRFGLTNTKGLRFVSWSIDMRDYLAAHPEQRLIGPDGKPRDDLVATPYLLGEAWPAVEAQLAKLLGETKPQVVDYDFEYSPFNGPHSDYSERSLAAFREFAGLPADAELSPEIIADRHDEAWVDYMAHQVAAVMERMKASVHKVAPATQFSIYSGYQSPDNPRRYGIDWRYIGERQAADHAGAGYGRPAEHIAATLEALDGIPLTVGAIVRPYDTAKDEPLLPVTPARMLRRFLDGSGGVLVYDRLPADGRVYRAVAEATRLAAEHEDLFLTGRRGTLPEQPEATVTTLRGDGRTLVFVLNDSSKPLQRTVTLPAEAGAGREFYTGAAVAAGASVTVDLQPGEARVYVLGG